MDLTFTPEQEAYRDAVREFTGRTLRPLVSEKYDFSRLVTAEEIAELRKELTAYPIAVQAPIRDDGTFDFIGLGIFLEEISKVNIGLASLASALFFPVWEFDMLLDKGQRERYGYMFDAGKIVAVGMSEPDAGSDAGGIRTTARRTDNGWVINGRKMWSSHAQIASGIIVTARRVDEDNKVSLFILDKRYCTYQALVVPTIGFDATSVCEVVFDNCLAPLDAELTPGPDGLRNALTLTDGARMKLVFFAVGLAQAALDLAVQYAKERTQFGRTIGGYQLVQSLLAEMATEVTAARLLGFRAASMYMAGEPTRQIFSIAKSFATEAAVRITSKAIQVHGAMGLTKECAAERLFRDARMLTIPNGTTQIHQLTIGRALTGISAMR